MPPCRARPRRGAPQRSWGAGGSVRRGCPGCVGSPGPPRGAQPGVGAQPRGTPGCPPSPPAPLPTGCPGRLRGAQLGVGVPRDPTGCPCQPGPRCGCPVTHGVLGAALRPPARRGGAQPGVRVQPRRVPGCTVPPQDPQPGVGVSRDPRGARCHPGGTDVPTTQPVGTVMHSPAWGCPTMHGAPSVTPGPHARRGGVPRPTGYPVPPQDPTPCPSHCVGHRWVAESTRVTPREGTAGIVGYPRAMKPDLVGRGLGGVGLALGGLRKKTRCPGTGDFSSQLSQPAARGSDRWDAGGGRTPARGAGGGGRR